MRSHHNPHEEAVHTHPHREVLVPLLNPKAEASAPVGAPREKIALVGHDGKMMETGKDFLAPYVPAVLVPAKDGVGNLPGHFAQLRAGGTAAEEAVAPRPDGLVLRVDHEARAAAGRNVVDSPPHVQVSRHVQLQLVGRHLSHESGGK